jgi:hypothetical protein
VASRRSLRELAQTDSDLDSIRADPRFPAAQVSRRRLASDPGLTGVMRGRAAGHVQSRRAAGLLVLVLE